jgi:hypothetical protein
MREPCGLLLEHMNAVDQLTFDHVRPTHHSLLALTTATCACFHTFDAQACVP